MCVLSIIRLCNFEEPAMILIVCLVFFLSVVVATLILNRIRNRTLYALPGPRTYPIIGNAFDLVVSTEKVWTFLRNSSKKYYPTYKIELGDKVPVQLLNPEDIRKVISHTNNLEKSGLYLPLEPWLKTGLLTSTGSKWHSRRKILTPAFHFTILQHFLRIIVEQSHLLIERLNHECNKESTEILFILSKFTLHTICESALGTTLDSQQEQHISYVQYIRRIGELIIHRVTRPWLHITSVYYFTPYCREMYRIIKYLHNFSMDVIRERKLLFQENSDLFADTHEFSKNKKLAMLDVLILAQRNGVDIDDAGIREEVDTFMFEGHDTTLSAISFTLVALANNPQIQDTVVEELNRIFDDSARSPTYEELQRMNYLELVIKESLRMYPSVPLISRITDETIVTEDGYTIPSGTTIQILIWDVHYNPDIYPEPNKFDPDRFLPENSKKRHHYAYLPFSAGSRNCIGQKFAMMELKVALSSILRHFVLTPVDRPEDLVFVTDLLLRTKKPLRVKFTRRQSK